MCTVSEHLAYLFSHGYDYTKSLKGVSPENDMGITQPIWPPDLFGAMASLSNLSGAYHHFKFNDASQAERSVDLSKRDVSSIKKCAKEWAGDDTYFRRGRMHPIAETLWNELIELSDVPVFERKSRSNTAVDWWKITLKLMLIADQVCESVGFLKPSGEETWIDFVTGEMYLKPRFNEIFALNSLLNKDACCVAPKSTQPSVGCTLRSLSRNLAITSPQGVARANWHFRPDAKFEEQASLNLLLVPFPYDVTSHCFVPDHKNGDGQGWFSMNQLWLGTEKEDLEKFVQFVDNLILQAERDGSKVGGLVFPELALSARYYLRLLRMVKNHFHLRVFVSGVNHPIKSTAITEVLDTASDIDEILASDVTSERHQDGNYVATFAGYHPNDQMGQWLVSFREKHHWWILDEPQIKTYSIGDVLDPDVVWREAIDLHSRSLDVFSISKLLTFTSLICEDLARIDPCQQLLRSIGPNLVFALLMDGPQLHNRWSSRYASVLSEDPGTAVLSLTSKGLINRQNQSENFEKSNSVALWCDSRGQRKSLNLEDGKHAILLKLKATKRQVEFAPTGVASVNWDWRYIGHMQLSADKEALPDFVARCRLP